MKGQHLTDNQQVHFRHLKLLGVSYTSLYSTHTVNPPILTYDSELETQTKSLHILYDVRFCNYPHGIYWSECLYLSLLGGFNWIVLPLSKIQVYLFDWILYCDAWKFVNVFILFDRNTHWNKIPPIKVNNARRVMIYQCRISNRSCISNSGAAPACMALRCDLSRIL